MSFGVGSRVVFRVVFRDGRRFKDINNDDIDRAVKVRADRGSSLSCPGAILASSERDY